jgi:hypothetical protein
MRESGTRTPLAARASREQEAQALHAALRVMEREHLGWVHLSGAAFTYRPDRCPGCAFSIVQALFRERTDG